MNTVVGVRFRNAGKVYFFAPGEYEVKKGMHVIVETARGVEYGTCVSGPNEVEDDKIVSPLKPILRIATEKDDKQALDNRVREKEAFNICQDRIRDHGLEMKLIDTEYTFDNNKILFYFTADGRVDFRDLVKDLAGIFRTRIELRQVGVRDETKILGGIGICGRPLCCHSYLSDFVPVSIKMAKEQNLSLNPTKISGVCGRLMCCLANEEEVYEEQNRKLPGAGDYVTTVEGERGIVHSVDIFRETVKVLVQTGDDKELKEYGAADIRFKKHRKRGRLELTPEEMEQLRALEPEDVAALEAEIMENPEDAAEFSIRDKYKDKDKDKDKGRGRDRDNADRDDDKDSRNRDRDSDRDGKNRDRDRNRDRNRNRDNRDNRGDRDNKDNRDNRGDRENKDNRDNKDNRENKGGKESRDGRDNRDNREERYNKENRETKDNKTENDNAEARSVKTESAGNADSASEDRSERENRNNRNNRSRRRGGHGRRDDNRPDRDKQKRDN
jgi:cell fate regulator YaaT (PSP1 superfamily)